MKTFKPVLLSLFFLTLLSGCGNEQFGTGGQSSDSTANPLKSFSYQACSNFTLIKPKVDVLYVVDNSGSSGFIPANLKSSISSTVDKLSRQFDFRVVGIPLISTSNTDYNVITNSTDLAGINSTKIITSAGQFGFFQNASGGGYEQGLLRTYNFLNANKDGLFRRNSHLIVVLVSNGLDANIEFADTTYQQNPPPIVQRPEGPARMDTYQSNLMSVKNHLQSLQLRFISVSAHSSCGNGSYPSVHSYVAMSRRIYEQSGASDQGSASKPDAYDMCSNGVSKIFDSLNSAIQQVTLAHEYKYSPITFLDNNTTVSVPDIKVTKISPSNSKVELVRDVDWRLYDRGVSGSENTRILPSVGEPVNGRYFVEFINGYLKYPDCVIVTSVSQTETFNMVVFPQKPIMPAKVFVNGAEIPASALASSVSNFQTANIKFSPSSTPPVMKTGYFLQITNPQYYYKSGDSVTTSYTAAGL